MSYQETHFVLPRNIEQYLATLSKLYAQEGDRLLQELLVNARIRVEEEWNYDNWNGGTYGHALQLTVPEPIFLAAVLKKETIQEKLKTALNKLHNEQNEYFAQVFIAMDVAPDSDWRQESGVLLQARRSVPMDAGRRIWGTQGFRLFLSHKAESKKEVAILKARLRQFGIAGFVAHEDIQPTKAWQDEIESALASMDGFVALMTENFHDSDWTDQEVGYALARGVPIIAVRLGRDPYGFIGKFQALSCSWVDAPVEIVKLLINDSRVFNGYIQALRECPSWEEGNELAKILSGIETLSTEQIADLVAAYNETTKLHRSWGFNGTKPNPHGPGLVWHLNRFGSEQYDFTDSGLIEESIPF
jgi:hypothetical protein